MAKEYNITKTSGRCVACQREMAPGEEYIATIREAAAASAPPAPVSSFISLAHSAVISAASMPFSKILLAP